MEEVIRQAICFRQWTSINNLTEENFEHILKHDLIGFNYWIVHNFVPDFYIAQFPDVHQQKNYLKNMFINKINVYKDARFMIKGSLQNSRDISFVNQFIKQTNFEWTAAYIIAFDKSIRSTSDQVIFLSSKMGLLNHGMIGSALVQYRSTVTQIISLAVQMGYDEIILLGIDMNDNSHFWDT